MVFPIVDRDSTPHLWWCAGRVAASSPPRSAITGDFGRLDRTTLSTITITRRMSDRERTRRYGAFPNVRMSAAGPTDVWCGVVWARLFGVSSVAIPPMSGREGCSTGFGEQMGKGSAQPLPPRGDLVAARVLHVDEVEARLVRRLPEGSVGAKKFGVIGGPGCHPQTKS